VLGSFAVKLALLLLAIGATIVPESRRPPGAPPSVPERRSASLTVRFVREQIVTCEEPRHQFYRKRPTCKAERHIAPGMATLELKPLPDTRRGVFGPDKRKPVTVELRCEDRAAEKSLTIERGPWALNWVGTGKSLRVEMEQGDRTVMLTNQLGACNASRWHCKLDPSAVSNRMELAGTGLNR
jgi:hypothetical protein